MANAGILIGWNEAARGREAQAGELWTSTLTLFQSKVDDGTFESFEPVIFSRHGGDLNGFFLVRGDQGKLDAYRHTDEFLDVITQAAYCLDGFGVIDVYIGDGLANIMSKWMAVVAKG